MNKLASQLHRMHEHGLAGIALAAGVLTLIFATVATFGSAASNTSHAFRPSATIAAAIATTQPSLTPTATPAVLGASHSPATQTRIPTSTFPLHQGIIATYFYGGESASSDNNWQTNTQTAWCDNWAHCFGGTDTPNSRQHNGDWPASFKPKENPFYVALPCQDFGSGGLRPDFQQFATSSSQLKLLTHNEPLTSTTSVLKNRWIKISASGNTVYGQWEDTGPFASPNDNDCQYVFGNATAHPDNQFGEHAGIDVSPAIELRLHLTGANPISWQFVDKSQVPAGPWTEITTNSPPYWP